MEVLITQIFIMLAGVGIMFLVATAFEKLLDRLDYIGEGLYEIADSIRNLPGYRKPVKKRTMARKMTRKNKRMK